MLFCHKDLINCFGFSQSSYFRHLKYFKKNTQFQKTSPGYLLQENEADQIAKGLGFLDKFEQFKKQKLNGGSGKNKN